MRIPIAILGVIISTGAFFGASAADVLSEDRLNGIIAKPHSNQLSEPALRIYPKARRYEIAVTSTLPDGRSETGQINASEKWVDGRYIVSEIQPAGPETKFQMVVEYDSDSKTYRKYLIMRGKLFAYQVGTRVGETRSVAWLDLTKEKFASGSDNIGIESHADDATTWTALFFQKGVLQRTETGVAKVSNP